MIFQIKKYLRSKRKDHFQDVLIEKLNKEHQKLFELVGKMEEVLQKENYKKLNKLIAEFKKELELHVLYEDTNLYEHLYTRYYYYDDIKSIIKQKHDEINNIATAVEEFISKYAKLGSNNIEEFKKEFSAIKDVLVKRVSFEENSLYDIYMNNYKKSEILKKLK